jgi:hypothetical protein
MGGAPHARVLVHPRVVHHPSCASRSVPHGAHATVPPSTRPHAKCARRSSGVAWSVCRKRTLENVQRRSAGRLSHHLNTPGTQCSPMSFHLTHALPSLSALDVFSASRYSLNSHSSDAGSRGKKGQPRDVLSLPLLPFHSHSTRALRAGRGVPFHPLFRPRALIHLDDDSRGIYEPANLAPLPRSFVFHRTVLDTHIVSTSFRTTYLSTTQIRAFPLFVFLYIFFCTTVVLIAPHRCLAFHASK